MIVLQLAEDPAKQEHLEEEGEMQGFQVKNFPRYSSFIFIFHYCNRWRVDLGELFGTEMNDFDLINSKNLFLISHLPISFFLVGIVWSTGGDVVPRYILLVFFFNMVLLNQIMLLILRN